MNGSPDLSFISMNDDPYFSSDNGGDYHVYPDGRVLMSGVHLLLDTIRGFTGSHCLIWFSNEGYLDTTAHHRKCSGSLDFFQQLPDGKFIGSGNMSTWEGQPASRIIRFHPDGALDTTFHANAVWGYAHGFLPLQDGRVYAVGRFRVQDLQDTLYVVRFMPDGSLDPTFNNTLKFDVTEMDILASGGIVRKIYQLDPNRLIVTGKFEEVEGQVRKCIAMVDTNGYLLDDPFANAGVGNFAYQGTWGSAIQGFTTAPDGNYYVWGSYHGYNDGTTNDTLQRMISRLYGPHVGVNEKEEKSPIKIFPNPGENEITIDPGATTLPAKVKIYSQTGELVLERSVKGLPIKLNTRKLSPGLYSIQIESAGKVYRTKWVKE